MQNEEAPELGILTWKEGKTGRAYLGPRPLLNRILSSSPVARLRLSRHRNLVVELLTLTFWCCPASAFCRGCYWLLEKKERGEPLLSFQLPQTPKRFLALW